MRLSNVLIMSALTFSLSGGVGAAGIGNPATDSPLTPNTGAGSKLTNNVDQLFVYLLGSGGHAEVELGGVAADKGQDGRVRDFGKRMVEDHKQANKKLLHSADAAGLEVPGNVADTDHLAQRKHLGSLKGNEFDKEYLRTQIADHQRTAMLLTWEVGSGQNEGLKDFAAITLPTVLDHLQDARDILDQLAVSKP